MFHWLFHSHRPRVRVTNVTGLDRRAQGLLRRVELSTTLLVVTVTDDNRPVIVLSGDDYGSEVLWEGRDAYATRHAAKAAGYEHLRVSLRSLLLQTEVRA